MKKQAYNPIRKTKGCKGYIRSLFLILLVFSFIMSGCSKPDMDESISDTQFMLGTIITIQLFGTKDESLIDESFQIIQDVENQMSLSIENSELNLLNEAAGSGFVETTDHVFFVIQKALEYSRLSSGGFDISLEPVISLWNIGTEEARVPEANELTEALKKVDYKKIQIDESNTSVSLEEGMSLDLGGIAKGYAADLVSDYLREEGITKAILNLGGNVLVIGTKSEDSGFKVGLQNPFSERNVYFGIVEVSDKTVVTSGIYERNFTQDGVTYHHILDTISGYPVTNGVAAVSVIASQSIDADALSTLLFVMGVDKGIALCESLEGVECIYVTDDSKLTMTKGAMDIFQITDDSFIIEE
jgi:thiamine biosynthesis lipoprotein